MVKSLERALNILLYMGSPNKEYSLTTLSQKLDIPPSTVRRLLVTLKNYHFVKQDKKTQMYSLGPSLMVLGMKVYNQLNIRESAMPVLKELTRVTKEDSYLTIPEGDNGVFLERVKGPYPLKVIENLGTQNPLHLGAMRKVILAFKEDDFINSYIERNLKDNTTDIKKFKSELKNIRKKGVAVTVEDYTKHGAGVAAPVRDASGSVIASIGIIGPVVRLKQNRLPGLIKEVKQKARQLSFAMGYTPE